MKCQLCGNVFDEKQTQHVCNSCLLTNNCPLIRCPNCNYEWPRENSSITKLTTLNKMKNKDKGEIMTICATQNQQLKIIISMGIMPGMIIEVIKRYPTLLCKVGFSQFALDKEIAKFIIVSIIK